jgi:hypothetical protein
MTSVQELKQSIREFHQTKNSLLEATEHLESPAGRLRLAFSLSDDLERVECFVRSRDAFPATIQGAVDELIAGLNQCNGFPLNSIDMPGHLFAAADIPFAEFVSAPDDTIEKLFLAAMPAAVLAGLALVEKLKQGKTPSEALDEYEAGLTAAIRAGNVSRIRIP